MPSNTIPSSTQLPTSILLSPDGQLPVFYLINVEYFFLYHGIKDPETKEVIHRGLSNNLISINANLQSKAIQWENEHNFVIDNLASRLALEVKQRQKQLPITALKRLPQDIKGAQHIITRTPNDHLCHFHLAWLYSIAKDFTLAEKHFNVSALQSQSISPSFSCFAYRHLAHAHFKNNRFSQALLAIEAASELSQSFHPELLFERIRFLSRAERTTQAIPHLSFLIKKAPHYEVLASHDKGIQENPSLQRYFKQATEKHIVNIQRQLAENWKNDPLHLLNLDRELGQDNTITILKGKQLEMLQKLSPLLVFNEKISSKLIQKCSRSIVLRSLDIRKQQYIHSIEGHQKRASKVHQTGQWMLYSAVVCLIALGLSYAISTIALQFNYDWPINLFVQSIVLGCTIGLVVLGAILLHFMPRKLSNLLKQKQKLDKLGERLGVSEG